MNRSWSAGGIAVGTLSVVGEKDFGRVGYCWMRGRLLKDDLVMAVRQSGDCFWQYRLVNRCVYVHEAGVRWVHYQLIEGSEFGAYVLGELFAVQPTEREVHLLLAGGSVPLEDDPKNKASSGA